LNVKVMIRLTMVFICLAGMVLGCNSEVPSSSGGKFPQSVPREQSWGIYALDLTTEAVEMIYSSDAKLEFLDLNQAGDTFAFSEQFAGSAAENEEICTVGVDGAGFRRLTNNQFMDIYPVWSPDGDRFAFLSWRETDLDIYLMDSNGDNQIELYDSGSHDADIDWVGSSIVFTSGSRIWLMGDDGSNAIPVTDPQDAGVWGDVNLPFGDYDPRLSPDGQRIVFERLEDDASPHGNYNFFIVNADGSNEVRLTDSGYSQGIASWSHAQDRLVFVVAAVGSNGRYDIYTMDSTGANITNITPDYFPPDFLCHWPVFSIDDSMVFFIGQWWS